MSYSKLKDLWPLFKKLCDAIADQTGWVGWFPIGGLDENGLVRMES